MELDEIGLQTNAPAEKLEECLPGVWEAEELEADLVMGRLEWPESPTYADPADVAVGANTGGAGIPHLSTVGFLLCQFPLSGHLSCLLWRGRRDTGAGLHGK